MPNDTPVEHLRRVRSFVRREGRMTRGQQRAMAELFPRYGLVPGEQQLDLPQVFGRNGPCCLEIGFGNGGNLEAMALQHPEVNYLGVEVHRPGVGNLLLQIEEHGIENIRVICADAVEVLKNNIPPASLDAVFIFFPDPWHKRRHQKRRLVQEAFIELVRERLKPGGILHMATDWEDYARHMLAVMQQVSGYVNTAPAGDYAPRPAYRVLTKFEQRGLRLGHGVWDLIFRRESAA